MKKMNLLVMSLVSAAALSFSSCSNNDDLGGGAGTQSQVKGSVAAQPKLQSEPRFITVGGNGGYVSRSMWLVRFKRDMSIVKISAQ